jgi:hypothetical protein
MRLAMSWDDSSRRFSVRLAPGSRMRPPARRTLEVRLAGTTTSRPLVFDGKPVELLLR